ncbi:MAG: hypothetical protein LBF89_05915 [Bacteroidales bacterium]|jgi:ABC-type Fe3+-siderophore transport system permease subunit|nr:hypothetical protein [Bacteroidales bacterium]
MESFILSFFIPVAYIALFLGALGVIAFAFIQIVLNFKKAKAGLLGFAALAAVFLLCFLIAPGQATEDFTSYQMKIIDTGIYAVYVTLAGAIITILYSIVVRYFK